ncbi:hypothetical protein psal_cds_1172 [Pandoravirus salinus]|uniref:F-box incomplete domain containing protein n=1 Tax=Pandoravirus salinus TaxID=1349410 RepID=S4VYL4_9VIRU|nr:hypothetical protein psal_cds_1172 [Pandoravirus salinus]AGO85448.1 hypothetical protein psal_cds_1172 [Pandoravirus salinus]
MYENGLARLDRNFGRWQALLTGNGEPMVRCAVAGRLATDHPQNITGGSSKESFSFLRRRAPERRTKKKATDRGRGKKGKEKDAMSSEQEAAAPGCPISDLPVEILAFVLNGHVRSPRRAPEGADMFPLCGDTRDRWVDRPLLDGRWRFAARAVCRAWRAIIENPSLADAAALDAYRPFASGSLLWLRRCPKWSTGRIVCLTAAADTVATHSALWARDPEAAFGWCRRNAGATRKQMIAALVASGVPWAVDAVVDHHWPLISFSGQGEGPSAEHLPVAAAAPTPEPITGRGSRIDAEPQHTAVCDGGGERASTAEVRPWG